MTTIKTLADLPQDTLLCDLPDSEFQTGGAMTVACRAAGYDESGRVTVNSLNAWGMTVAEFSELLSSDQAGEEGTR